MPEDTQPPAPGRVEVRVIGGPEEMQEAFSIRLRVFVEEQHVPIEEEVDAFDERPGARDDVVQVLVRVDGQPAATARLLLGHHEGYPHVGRVAVLAEHRGTGLGRVVMEALHQEARRRGERGITLSAQLHAIPFYERLGYVARGPVYLDAGIEHRDMDLPFES
ncbi:MAG: GNAT family N-acetyltransferase [Dehalococcoidia bacterium]